MTEGGGEAKASGDAPAVLISHASRDAAAVERICASLRAAGVELWLDQSELRGGAPGTSQSATKSKRESSTRAMRSPSRTNSRPRILPGAMYFRAPPSEVRRRT
jgi:hypothetical protein